MEFGGNHGPLVASSHGVRFGPFGERLTLDGHALQDGRHNRPYPGQVLSPGVTVLPLQSGPASPHLLYKLDDDLFDADDATQRGFFGRLRNRRRSSTAARDGLARSISRQTTSSEGALSFDSDEGVRRGDEDGPGPYEVYGQLDRIELAQIYTAIGAYYNRWATLPSLPRRPEWMFASIPWPCASQPSAPSELDPSMIRTFLLAALGYGQERHQRLGTEMQRWQPEDFSSKWLVNVKSTERAKVVQGIAVVRRVLMELKSEDQ